MALSKVQIFNMALSMIGDDSTVESITENSAQAKECALWYDQARQEALVAFDWNFARKRATLAAHADDPPEDIWAYAYQYPADCLKMRQIQNPAGKTADAVPFAVETDASGSSRIIFVDNETAIGVYTRDLETIALFPPSFGKALAAVLAVEIAYPLTSKAAIVDKMRERVSILMSRAMADDAQEGIEQEPRDADWIRNRP